MGACPKPNTSIIYAYLSIFPYVLALLLFFISIITRKVSHIKLSLLIGSSYVVGDKILKKILKSTLKYNIDPRPPYSCKSSYGMPSSHMIVITVFGFMRIKSKDSYIL